MNLNRNVKVAGDTENYVKPKKLILYFFVYEELSCQKKAVLRDDCSEYFV